MELVNHTRYPAGLARMVYAEDKIAASVLVRVLYERKGASFVPADEQPWIVSMSPWEGPRGWMDGDLVFYKDGVDVFLFGAAIPPGGRPATEMEVAVRMDGGFERRVKVSGPRVWARGISGLSATSPRPFTAMPLTLAHAFGGKDTYDGLTVGWPENPDGIGFYHTEESAVDKPLPNVEELDAPLIKWDDRPPAAGLVPIPVASPVRARQGLAVNGKGFKITPRLYNAAFARMIAREATPGASVAVSGVSPKGPLVMTLPLHPFFVRLGFGDQRHDLPMAVDQVGILADEDRMMVAYRYPFRYVVHAMQERRCELFEGTPEHVATPPARGGA